MVRDEYDAVVIGGGAAGLNGALMLARSRRSVLVVDAGGPRNAPAHAVHGVLGHDGRAPAELLATGRREVVSHGGEILEDHVVAVRGAMDAFVVHTHAGDDVRARRILVATGLVDVLPDIPGLRERWGRDVLHCPYCHGWEVRDQAIGVLANGPMSVHLALLFRQLSEDVVLLAHGSDIAADEQARLTAAGVGVVGGIVAGLEVRDDRLAGIRMGDGTTLARQAMALTTRVAVKADFLRELGLVRSEHPSGRGTYLSADQTGATAVPGVWAAGNVADIFAQWGAAAASGAAAGAAINADLVERDATPAVPQNGPGGVGLGRRRSRWRPGRTR